MASSVDYDDNERIITTDFQVVSRGIKKKPLTSKVRGNQMDNQNVATAVTTPTIYIKPPVEALYFAVP
jgi:hypothetical protein